jgi:hypothetical protein
MSGNGSEPDYKTHFMGISSEAKKCYFIQVSLGPANEIEPDYFIQVPLGPSSTWVDYFVVWR